MDIVYILWALLNTYLLFYACYLVVGFLSKGKAIFSRRFKAISILVFIIGIIHVINGSQEQHNNQFLVHKDLKSASGKTYSATLESHWTIDINIDMNVVEQGGESILVAHNSAVSGWVSGFSWAASSYSIHEGRLELNGHLNWMLFGIKIYSAPKTYETAYS